MLPAFLISISPDRVALWLAAAAFFVTLTAVVRAHPPLRRALVAFFEFSVMAARYTRRRLRGGDEKLQAGPSELRRAFERLGPTYIKFGQLIASSSGLFPDRYVNEFQRCLDRVPPEPWPLVEQTLTRALGGPPRALLQHLETSVLASASIAQVFGAIGTDDEGAVRELVVKVQRRNLPELVRADVGMLMLGAELLQHVPRVRNANPRGIVAEFDRSIHEELDFLGEAQRMEEWNAIMRQLGRTDVCAPRPVRRLCRREVLVMERFHGVRVDDVEGIRARGYSAEQAEARLVDGVLAWFQGLLRFGFFHGDVHAGNLMMLDDGRLGFLDFGIIGRLGRTRRQQIARYIMAFATRDFAALARLMAEMGAVDAKRTDAEWTRFSEDLVDTYSPFLGKAMHEIDYTQVIPKLIRVSREHGTRLPSDFILITRQLLYFDRYAKLLAPSLNLFADPRIVLTIGAELALL